MELALSLGHETRKPFSFLETSPKVHGKELGFCMDHDKGKQIQVQQPSEGQKRDSTVDRPPVQLDLLPFSPVHRSQLLPSPNKFPFPWLNQKLGGEPGRVVPEVNRRREEIEEGSSPNSVVSSFQMDFSMFRGGKRDFNNISIGNEIEIDRGSNSRGSDDDESGMGRKKLRLTKDQSAFLEESFKEHNTLNPKQKLALAKQLNLRPRQVEVWFQNRRARTKLKQTEVDCEYLKRCCETLTDENRRLQKELQELRALKASQPFYRQRPATTLTMCPSCEVVSTNAAPSTAAPPATGNAATNMPSKGLSLDVQHNNNASSVFE